MSFGIWVFEANPSDCPGLECRLHGLSMQAQSRMGGEVPTMRLQTVGVAVAMALLGASPARAMLVDFTNAIWLGTASFDYGSLRVHISAAGGSLSVTGFDGNGAAAPCTPGTLACATDGIGIGGSDDEVTYGGTEMLTVTFTDLGDNPVPVKVLGIQFFDLFYSHPADPDPETAQWSYDIGGGGSLTGNEMGVGTGWATIALDEAGVHSITFFATSPLSSSNTDFALAALDVEQMELVPEPATLVLVGAGLLGLSLRRRSS
jgi:hypothetical protein